MTPESAAADIVLRLSDLAADSRENAQTVLQALLLELVEQNRVPQYDLELRDCHEQIAMLNRQLKAATDAMADGSPSVTGEMLRCALKAMQGPGIGYARDRFTQLFAEAVEKKPWLI